MARIQAIDCPECGVKIKISVRDDGEVTVLDSEKEEYFPLEELREV